jgi:branched-chain amino acid aminotransferase
MSLVNLNGTLLRANDESAGIPQLVHNRAFRLGDGLFETLRVMGGRVLFGPRHLQRLMHGVQVLGLRLPARCTHQYFLSAMAALAAENKLDQGGKVRLAVFRTGGEGAYLPVRDEADYLIEANAILHNTYPTDRTHRLAVYADWRVQPTPLSGLKTASALQYVMAARFAKADDADDALLLDAAGNIVETGKANLFIVQGSDIITPPVGSGCLDGVLRNELIALAKQNQLSVAMQPVSPHMLYEADAVFTTNVVSGIIPVHYIAGNDSVRAKSYDAANAIVRKLQQLLARHALGA